MRNYPGPRANEIVERGRAVEGSGPRTGGPDAPLVVERALGATIFDPDGNAFLDLASSFAVANVGHSHPAVVAAISEQAGRLSHVASSFLSEPRVRFEEALLDIAPAGLDRVLLGLSGADANDTALKLARTVTGRREILAFSGGYFGRASGVVGLNGKSRFRTAVGRDPEAHFLPFANPFRWPLEPAADVAGQAIALASDALEGRASGVGPVAAVVVEPIQGNGGVVVPPDGFLAGLRDLCDRTGALLIFDEIQCGFGRSGRMWAAEHWGVVPDLMTVGKGIGGGQPVSAVVGRSAAMSHWAPGTHTSTFMGNAIGLAAGTAAIGVARDEGLVERSARLGASLLGRLDGELADVPWVGDVRGRGLFVGIEIVADRNLREPDETRTAAIRKAAFERGVLLGVAGHVDNVLKICPPLTIDERELAEAVDATISAIRGEV
jgi:4-aminobutyrate aminotransferase-like enzyme